MYMHPQVVLEELSFRSVRALLSPILQLRQGDQARSSLPAVFSRIGYYVFKHMGRKCLWMVDWAKLTWS